MSSIHIATPVTDDLQVRFRKLHRTALVLIAMVVSHMGYDFKLHFINMGSCTIYHILYNISTTLSCRWFSPNNCMRFMRRCNLQFYLLSMGNITNQTARGTTKGDQQGAFQVKFDSFSHLVELFWGRDSIKTRAVFLWKVGTHFTLSP